MESTICCVNSRRAFTRSAASCFKAFRSGSRDRQHGQHRKQEYASHFLATSM